MRPASPRVARLIRAYYAMPGNEAGGNCHIVLDDGNLDDHSVLYCGIACEAAGDAAGLRLMRLFSEMKKTARRKAVALSMWR